MNALYAANKYLFPVVMSLFLRTHISAQSTSVASEQIHTQTIIFGLSRQPHETSGPASGIEVSTNSISTAFLPAFPAGTVITNVEFLFPGLSTTGNSFGSDVVFGFTGAVHADYTYGDHAPESAKKFDFFTAYENAAVGIGGGTVYLHYYDLLNDNPGRETIFPTGRSVAKLIISYKIETAGLILPEAAETIAEMYDFKDENAVPVSVEAPELYPNPAENYVYVSMQEDVQGTFSIFDLQGKLVASGSLSNGSEIDLSGAENGVYVVRIFAGNVLHTARIVKQ